MPREKRFASLAAATALALTLAGCMSGGGGLAPGLVARMDQPGASFDRGTALAILNDYRSSTGTAPLAADSGLDANAQSLAAAYARTEAAPTMPEGVVAMRVSAGYATFAETFSGWRNAPADAQVLAAGSATRAGLGVAYDANSTYGVYWVLLLED